MTPRQHIATQKILISRALMKSDGITPAVIEAILVAAQYPEAARQILETHLRYATGTADLAALHGALAIIKNRPADLHIDDSDPVPAWQEQCGRDACSWAAQVHAREAILQGQIAAWIELLKTNYGSDALARSGKTRDDVLRPLYLQIEQLYADELPIARLKDEVA